MDNEVQKNTIENKGEKIVTEKENDTIYFEGCSEKKQYTKKELNYKIKDLFEFCSINFLIGSGYCYERLQTLGNLESEIEKNSKNNKTNLNNKTAIESLILYDFFRNSILPHIHDLELKCSYQNSNIFIINLLNLLTKRNDKNLLKRINIFTTNYDMYFELSLEANKVNYNDGFSGRLIPQFSAENYNRIVKQIVQNTERESQVPTINLFKLHGSLSWKEDNGKIEYRSNISEVLKNIEEYAEVFNDEWFMYNKQYPINVQESIKIINDRKINIKSRLVGRVEKFNDAYKMLHIINPTKKKFEETLLLNIYYDLLRIYSNELEKTNSAIFVFGFSFKDEHIYSITKRALANPTMTMYIFVHDIKNLEDFKELFKEYSNVYYIYSENKRIDLCKFTSLMFGGKDE